MSRVSAPVLLAGAAVLWVLAAAGTGSARQREPVEDLSAYLPPGDGRALVVRVCANCHDLRGTLQLRKNRAAWEAVVLDMGARGAQFTLDDIDPMVAYLGTVFGPDAPPFVDVNADPPDRLAKIPGITAAAAEALVAARSTRAFTSADDVRAALGVDAAAFDRMRYYLYLKPKPRP